MIEIPEINLPENCEVFIFAGQSNCAWRGRSLSRLEQWQLRWKRLAWFVRDLVNRIKPKPVIVEEYDEDDQLGW